MDLLERLASRITGSELIQAFNEIQSGGNQIREGEKPSPAALEQLLRFILGVMVSSAENDTDGNLYLFNGDELQRDRTKRWVQGALLFFSALGIEAKTRDKGPGMVEVSFIHPSDGKEASLLVVVPRNHEEGAEALETLETLQNREELEENPGESLH